MLVCLFVVGLIYIVVKREMQCKYQTLDLGKILEIIQSIITNKREVIATAEDSSNGMF